MQPQREPAASDFLPPPAVGGEPILHHYDRSPFAEKVRLVFGLKRLAWRSVIQPMVLPKPALTALTGGFRRIPVLQVGADIVCDTNLIAATLERWFPEPSLFGPPSEAVLGAVLTQWADRVLFVPTARYVTAAYGGILPPGFHADRAAMRGEPAPDPARLSRAAPHHLAQLQLLLAQMERLLEDGRPFLLGPSPRLADFAVYARVWWLAALDGDFHEIEDLRRLREWRERVRAIGHGERREMQTDEAHAAAAGARPVEAPAGPRVRIATEGQPSDPVEGELVLATPDRLVLRRRDPALGELLVHFPTLGYGVEPLG